MVMGGWSVALTGVFAATGLYCLWRVMAGRSQGIETVADVNHVLMSPAMVVMLWWPSAGAGRWVEVTVFGGLALFFFHHLAGSVTVTARAAALMHAGMNVGMVWMLLAMPALMSGGGMEMDGGMAGMSGHQHGAGTTTAQDLVGLQAWSALLSWVVTGLLALAAAWWLVRAIRHRGHRVQCCCHGLACAGMGAMLALMIPGL